ncbi:uncharacterized protein A4U43_C01F29560 [Asparagus officinalis]|uniref:DRBM domain-containing protein n=1 Tax=Asparagus officinalis TaxID=4686 RepID=A0A5P1FTC8_ASPOF|nr:uncharacterized protein A4U43_C01F29560 [Asparagus officinalis]
MVEEFTRIVEREGEGEMYGQPYGGSTIKAPKVLADIVESIAAAVYVDCNLNLEKMWMVFRGLLEPIITAENLDEQPVTTLYEYCQKKGKALNFKNWKKGNVNVTNVFVDGELIGIGYSEHQNIAKLNAARDAIQKLGDLKGEHVDMDIGGEESNTAKHKLNEMCSKKHWPKPVYRSATKLWFGSRTPVVPVKARRHGSPLDTCFVDTAPRPPRFGLGSATWAPRHRHLPSPPPNLGARSSHIVDPEVYIT